MRAKAEAAQFRRNLGMGALICAFIGGVFTYSITAVEQDQITERELAEFRMQRERESAQGTAKR